MPPLGRRRISRRAFLAGVGATTVAACTSDGRPRSSGRQIVVANHPLYIDAGTNRDFTAATGIAVEYHEEVTDDDAWYAAVQSRLERNEPIDRDVVIVSDYVAGRLQRRGWLADPAPVTWAMGMVGVAYDAKAIGGDITRVGALFKPPLHGRVSLPMDMRASLGVALLADGIDPAAVTLADATASSERLANSVRLGQVLPIDRTPPIERLVAGDVDAAVVRASDTVGLDASHPEIRFVVPDEGGFLVTDVAAVLSDAADAQGAASYLAFVSDPPHAAERFRVVPAVWEPGPIDDVVRRDAPAVLADPRRYPPADVRARLHRFRLLTDDEETAFAGLFDGVVHAANR
jgi:spermidine/putrescine transport system substrate-binding protein